MISLKLTDISVDKSADKSLESGFLYKDIKLDLAEKFSYNKALVKDDTVGDVQAIFNLESVKNSILNCFLTSPGQKILSPEYGIDLRRYLFESVNNDTAYFINRDITSNLPRFEPRITVSRVRVIPDPDNQEYNIELTIDVPSLNAYGVTIKNTLNSNGYY